MRDFKFLREEDRYILEPISQLIYFNHNQQAIENVEFCFQFDDEEPIRFATGPNECHIRITPTAEGYMIFTDNGRRFKLFAREAQL